MASDNYPKPESVDEDADEEMTTAPISTGFGCADRASEASPPPVHQCRRLRLCRPPVLELEAPAGPEVPGVVATARAVAASGVAEDMAVRVTA